MVKNRNKGFFQNGMIFFATFRPTTKRQFFVRGPKRRLIQENQEKQYQETLKNQSKHGTDKEQGPRNEERHETKHRRKEGSKNQRHHFVFKKKMTTEDFEFVCARNRYGDEEKKGKEEGREE